MKIFHYEFGEWILCNVNKINELKHDTTILKQLIKMLCNTIVSVYF